LILAAIGGALGAAATYLVFDGFTAATLGSGFTQVVFSFRLSPALIGQGILLAVIVGFVGGLLPAIRAARMPIVAGLQS
jgi:putative ABC transport system permease protein